MNLELAQLKYEIKNQTVVIRMWLLLINAGVWAMFGLLLIRGL